MYLNQYWRDERLAFNAYGPYYDDDADDDGVNDVLTLSGDFAEKIWVPDTFFANDKNRYGNITPPQRNVASINRLLISF